MRLLTAKEVAAILGVKPARVYELSRIKLLPTVRMGRQVRYDESALLEWIKAGGMAHGDSGPEPDVPTRTRSS
jgi:excisionase family DNA binding protein